MHNCFYNKYYPIYSVIDTQKALRLWKQNLKYLNLSFDVYILGILDGIFPYTATYSILLLASC